ncbi:hypothetical protein ACSLBF_19240 (plasmid) [Pseudoalteromonas sp. T1lg65]
MKLKLTKKSIKELQNKSLTKHQAQQVAGAGESDRCWTGPAYAACRMN